MEGEDLDGRVGLEGLGVLRGSCAGEVEGGCGRGCAGRGREGRSGGGEHAEIQGGAGKAGKGNAEIR